MKLYPREVFVWTAAAIRQSTAPTRSKRNSPIASTASRDRSAGLREMLQKDAYCPDILIQVSAVSAALNSFSKELLATHIRTCVADGIRQGDDAVIDELVTTLQKLMK